ncbi:hypothetical protein [Streptomyces globisporus]|uniref:hypothetical protein n=1 Tax=Streptomyces globisporus TaxID=1908 RepID=UPI00386EC06B|nr:hypothetical protein OG449_07710 [Streptomyces globisporus]
MPRIGASKEISLDIEMSTYDIPHIPLPVGYGGGLNFGQFETRPEVSEEGSCRARHEYSRFGHPAILVNISHTGANRAVKQRNSVTAPHEGRWSGFGLELLWGE